MQRLPTNTQTVLSTSEDTLDKLAAMADRIHDIVSNNNIYSLEAVPDNAIAKPFEVQLNEIIKRLDRIELRERSKTSRRPRSRSTSRTQRKQTPTGHRYCWYHRRYGQEAKKCSLPCDWKDNFPNNEGN